MRSEDAPRRGSRVRVASLLTPPLLAAALFVAWGQPWVEITLSDGVSISNHAPTSTLYRQLKIEIGLCSSGS
jgi:hypothetical protein